MARKAYHGDRGKDRPKRFWKLGAQVEREDAETLARYAAEQAESAAFWATLSVILQLITWAGYLIIKAAAFFLQ